MELRWLKGNYEFGKYKLQYKIPWDGKNPGSGSPWFDVPIAESKPKVMTLEDKLQQGCDYNKMPTVSKLADIARQHFKEGGA